MAAGGLKVTGGVGLSNGADTNVRNLLGLAVVFSNMRSAPVLAFFGFLAALTVACSGGSSPASTPTPTPGTTGALGELESARAKWGAAGLDTFSYTFTDDCGECLPSHRAPRGMAVWDGQELDATGTTPSVEEIFARIETAIDDGQTVEVLYDSDTGVPLDVSIDMHMRPVDGGTHWTVDDIAAALPGDPVALAELEDAQALWALNGPDSYSFVVSVLCDCNLESNLYTEVRDGDVTDWEVLSDPTGPTTITPLTLDDLFRDLRDLVHAGEAGLVEGTIRFSGSARYDEEFGYPVWVGLDIELLEADPMIEELGLPGRVVFVIENFNALGPATEVPPKDPLLELEAARSRWAAQNPTTYVYELTFHDVQAGDFSGPYRVVVNAGSVASITFEGVEVEIADLPAGTVDQYFDLAEDLLMEGELVGIIYDRAYGYPALLEDGPAGFISIDNLVLLEE